MVGYGRLEGLVATEALARLYDSTRLFVNFFQPSFKLRSKERVGARVRKNDYTPETPCARLLGSEHVTEDSKERLRAVLATLEPAHLRTLQRRVKDWRRAAAQRLVFSPTAHASDGLGPTTPKPT